MHENSSQERHIADNETVFSPEYRAQWAEYIRLYWESVFPNVELESEEIAKAIDVIQEFERGMLAMHAAAEKRKLIPENHPKAKLALDGKGYLRKQIDFAAFHPKSRVILISIFYLFPKKVPVEEIKKKLKEVTFFKDGETYLRYLNGEISILDFAFLAGIHEYRHHLEENHDSLVKPTENVAEAYYAQDHEYRALGWMIFFAKKHNYSPDVIGYLESLLSRVIDYRQEVKQTNLTDKAFLH